MLIRRIPLFVAALFLAAAPALAQDHASHDKHEKLMKGSSLVLEGCVTTGENKDTFVIGKVREIPGRPVDTGLLRYYRFDDVSEFRGMAGKVVRIEGRIDEIEDGQIQTKLGEANNGGTLVELEGPGRDIDTTPEVIGANTVTADGQKKKVTIIVVDVDKVTAVRACR